MQFTALALSAFAATALAQGASQSADLVSILNVLQTALPSSIVAEALTNSAGVASQISSEFAAGATPSWYSALPSDVKTYLVPPMATGISGGSANGTATNGTATNGTMVGGGSTNGTATNGTTTSTTSTRRPATMTNGATGGAGSGSNSGNGGSQTSGSGSQGGSSSSSQSGNAAPTAFVGAGLAGAVGLVGLLAL